MKLSLLVLTLLASPAFAHPQRGDSARFDRPARADRARENRPTAERASARNDQPATRNERAPDRVTTCKKGECTVDNNHHDHQDDK